MRGPYSGIPAGSKPFRSLKTRSLPRTHLFHKAKMIRIFRHEIDVGRNGMLSYSAGSGLFVLYQKPSAFSSLRDPFGNHKFCADTHPVVHYIVIVA